MEPLLLGLIIGVPLFILVGFLKNSEKREKKVIFLPNTNEYVSVDKEKHDNFLKEKERKEIEEYEIEKLKINNQKLMKSIERMKNSIGRR